MRTGLGRRLQRAGVAVGTALLGACSLPQIMIGQWYAIPTPESGACPALLWRFVAGPQRTIGGSVAQQGQRVFATLSGTLDADDSVHMTITNLADKSTATVTGQFSAQVSTLTIQGDGVGTGCDGQTFSLRLGGYFARAGGGGGGGG